MKKLFWKSMTIVQIQTLGMILLALVSCSSMSSMHVQQQNDTTLSAIVHSDQKSDVSHVVLKQKDSVIIRERMVHDTVYITKEVYRDRAEASIKAQLSTQSDTVVVTEWREKVVERPPERYVPTFYKWSTLILWLGLAIIVIWLVLRWKR